MACSISVWALSGDQSGVSNSLANFTPALSRTLCAPCLYGGALESVGDPWIATTGPVGLPSFLRASRRAWPCCSPTFLGSIET